VAQSQRGKISPLLPCCFSCKLGVLRNTGQEALGTSGMDYTEIRLQNMWMLHSAHLAHRGVPRSPCHCQGGAGEGLTALATGRGVLVGFPTALATARGVLLRVTALATVRGVLVGCPTALATVRGVLLRVTAFATVRGALVGCPTALATVRGALVGCPTALATVRGVLVTPMSTASAQQPMVVLQPLASRGKEASSRCTWPSLTGALDLRVGNKKQTSTQLVSQSGCRVTEGGGGCCKKRGWGGGWGLHCWWMTVHGCVDL
jgi:hypothetical protein